MFRLHESPKFLVASNRPSAAVVTLRRISKINGDEAPWALSDGVDHHHDRNDDRAADGPSHSSGSLVAKSPPGYAAMGHTSPESRPRSSLASPFQAPSTFEDGDLSEFTLPDSALSFDGARSGALNHQPPAWIERLPAALQGPVTAYADRFSDLLAPKWRRTTLFVWTIWTLASAGYTVCCFCPRAVIFFTLTDNLHASSRSSTSFSPSFLNQNWPIQLRQDRQRRKRPCVPVRLSGRISQRIELKLTRRSCPADVMYTVSGLPGSLVGAYLVETPLGRARTLAISTLATSAATVVFVYVNTSVGIVLSSMAVSFASTLMCASSALELEIALDMDTR